MTKEEAQAAVDAALIEWRRARNAYTAADNAANQAHQVRYDASAEYEAAAKKVLEAQHAYADALLGVSADSEAS